MPNEPVNFTDEKNITPQKDHNPNPIRETDKTKDLHDELKKFFPDEELDFDVEIEDGKAKEAFLLGFRKTAGAYPNAGKNAPKEVRKAINRFKKLPQDKKNNTVLLYWLLGSGTPEYKMPKDKADYKTEPQGDQVCGNCQFAYVETDGDKHICSKVRGPIELGAWCKLWAPSDNYEKNIS